MVDTGNSASGLYVQTLEWPTSVQLQVEVEYKNDAMKQKYKSLMCTIFIFLLVYMVFSMLAEWTKESSWSSSLLFANVIKVRNSMELEMQKLQTRPGSFINTSLRNCSLPYLKHSIKFIGTKGKRYHLPKCERLKPIAGSCDVADKLFTVPVEACDKERIYEICKSKVFNSKIDFWCNSSFCSGAVSVDVVLQTSGKLWSLNFTSETSLKRFLVSLTDPSLYPALKHFGFCVLKCNLNEPNEETDYTWSTTVSQLLLLPPQISLEDTQVKNLNASMHPYININLIILDSTSRHHFFRSLPKTIKSFEALNSDPQHDALVLDYELFQAIKSRTKESFQMLFEGQIKETLEPLMIETILKPYKNLGYQTLWLEDVCWRWEWGLTRDLCIYDVNLSNYEKWKKLQTALHKASVDRIDVTLASCLILDALGLKDPFGYRKALCYNGHYHHEYLFKYLWDYQLKMISLKRPFFSIYENNIGHEASGTRIHTMDDTLSEYVRIAAKMQNVLTIIVADHGNSYGDYISESQEARVELFHPSLFLVVPNLVRKYLGREVMQALVVNQKRLTSLFDVHKMLSFLSVFQDGFHKHSNSRPGEGLMSLISPNRTCHDIPRVMPNLCICAGYEAEMRNSSYAALFAHFAVGELNKELNLKYDGSRFWSRRCRRLVPVYFENVKRSLESDGTYFWKMDIMVNSELSSDPEIFFVIVNGGPGKGMKLESFDRLTEYRKFEDCADPLIDLKLCVCSSKSSEAPVESLLKEVGLNTLSAFMEIEEISLEGTDKCLRLAHRKNDRGSVIEAGNFCKDRLIFIEFSMDPSILGVEFSAKKMPVLEKLHPGEVRLIFVAIATSELSNWSWKYSFKYSWTKIPANY